MSAPIKPEAAAADTTSTAKPSYTPDQLRAMDPNDYARYAATGNTELPPTPASVHQTSLFARALAHVKGLVSLDSPENGNMTGEEVTRRDQKAAGEGAAHSAIETIRGAPREIVETGGQIMQSVADLTGMGYTPTPDATVTHFFGAPTTDNAARFALTTLKVVGTLAAAPEGAPALAKAAFGAVGLGVTTNPYEEGLLNLAADATKQNQDGLGSLIHQIASGAAVNESDDSLTARLKSTGQWFLGDLAVMGIVQLGKAAAAYRVLASDAGSAAKEAAAKTLDEAAAAVRNPVTPGPVQVVQNADGSASTVVRDETVAAQQRTRDMITRGQQGTAEAGTQDNAEYIGKKMLGLEDAPAQEVLPGAQGAPDRHIYRVPGKGVLVVRAPVGDIPAYPTILYTDPSVRGQGIATSLIEKARADFKAKGLGDIAVNANDLSPMRARQLLQNGSSGRPVFETSLKPNEASGLTEEVVTHGVPLEPAATGPKMTPEEAASSANAANMSIETTVPAQKVTDAINPPKAEPSVAEVGTKAPEPGTAVVARRGVEKALTPEELRVQAQALAFKAEADRLITAAKAGDATAIDRLTNGTHFNFGIANNPAEVNAQIEALSTFYGKLIDDAKGRPGMTVGQLFQKIQENLDGFTDDAILLNSQQYFKEVHENVATRLTLRTILNSKSVDMAAMGEAIARRPNDQVLLHAYEKKLHDFYMTAEVSAGLESAAGRDLRFLQETGNPDLPARGKKPFDAAEYAKKKAAQNVDQGTAQSTAQGAGSSNFTPGAQSKFGVMTAQQAAAVRAQAAMFRMAKGKLVNIPAVIAGAKVYRHTGLFANALQVFRNSLLSGIKTVTKVAQVGQMMNAWEASLRVTAGLATADRATIQEGVDILHGMFSQAGDATAAFVATSENGFSAARPRPQHIALPFATQAQVASGTVPAASEKAAQLINIPGRIVGGADDFTFTQAYRAKVVAAAKEEIRGGILGPNPSAFDRARHIDDALRGAYDPQTGIATLQDFKDYAEQGTFQAPLRPGTFGRAVQKAVQEYPPLAFLDPFVVAGGNGLDWAQKTIPVLAPFHPTVAADLAAGGRRQAVALARMAQGSAVLLYAGAMVQAGKMTGSGPSDKGAAAVWSQNNEPYSINVAPEGAAKPQWMSYKSMEPFNTLFGLVADGHMIYTTQKLSDSGDDKPGITGALLAAAYQATINKTYNQGFADFQEAFTSRGGEGVGKWMSKMAATFVTPQILNSFNTDPIIRRSVGFIETLKNKTPVLSKSVPPAYNWLSEYQYYPTGDNTFTALVNARSNFASIKQSQGDSLDEAVTRMGRLAKGFSPPPRVVAGGTIDYADPKYADKNGETPYDFMARAVRDGMDGEPGLREQLTKMVFEPGFNDWSDGTDQFPGGAQYMQVAQLKQGMEAKALAAAREHFPALAADLDAYRVSQKAALLPPTERNNLIQLLTK